MTTNAERGASAGPVTTRKDIDDFFALKRIAFVGLSRDEKDFSRNMFRELDKRGYDLVPVNPEVSQLEDRRCYARVQDIPEPVEGALVMTPAQASASVVEDCAEAGVERIWLHRGAGVGAVSDEAVALCREHGMRVVVGHCAFMFLPETGFGHRLHRFFKRIGGGLPK